jgi:CheY-like chemotaxis protein
MKKGFSVITIDSGLKALAMLETMAKLPNLIILDVLMPSLNGLEVLKVLKLNPRYKTIPVFMWSNLNEKDDVKKALSIGAAYYLAKIDSPPSEVLEKIEKVIHPGTTQVVNEIKKIIQDTKNNTPKI